MGRKTLSCCYFCASNLCLQHGDAFVFDDLRPLSVARKFFRSNVVLIDANTDEHLAHRRDHGWRSGNVVDRPLETFLNVWPTSLR